MVQVWYRALCNRWMGAELRQSSFAAGILPLNYARNGENRLFNEIIKAYVAAVKVRIGSFQATGNGCRRYVTIKPPANRQN